MAKGKKYDSRITQQGSSWTAEIIRRVTSKKTTVSKRQSGFATESEAEQWAQKELESFLQSLKQRNLRHANQRK